MTLCKLADVAVLDRTAADPTVIASESYLSLEDIDSESGTLIENYREPAKSTKYIYTTDHVLFGKLRPYLRKVARPKTSGICSTDIIPIKPTKQLDKNYLYHFLRTDEIIRKATKLAVGVNLPRIGPKQLSTFDIPLPTLSEQKRIASILDAADALRAKRRESIAQLDTLLQSTFLDMFGDPVSNPMGWEVVTVGDLLQSAKYGTSKKASAEEGQYEILRMNNITYSGDWDLRNLKYIDLNEAELSKYLVNKGQILFNRTNSKELVGKTAVYRRESPMAFAGYLVRGSVNDSADAEYIGAFMNTPQTKKYLRNKCKNIVGMANINAKEFQKIPIPKPPVGLQVKFAKLVTAIHSERKIHQRHAAKLDLLFSSLQQRAFNGQL